MAGRGRAVTTGPRAGAGAGHGVEPLIYTAQDVARFCEVDLKTIHHWADAGKIAHHRTEGRHLRFRRNHVIAFLRLHGYPLHAEITHVRPSLFLAAPTPSLPFESEHLEVRVFDTAISAIAQLALCQPDALVLSMQDTTIQIAAALEALKSDPATSWIAIFTIETPEELAALPLKLIDELAIATD